MAATQIACALSRESEWAIISRKTAIMSRRALHERRCSRMRRLDRRFDKAIQFYLQQGLMAVGKNVKVRHCVLHHRCPLTEKRAGPARPKPMLLRVRAHQASTSSAGAVRRRLHERGGTSAPRCATAKGRKSVLGPRR